VQQVPLPAARAPALPRLRSAVLGCGAGAGAQVAGLHQLDDHGRRVLAEQAGQVGDGALAVAQDQQPALAHVQRRAVGLQRGSGEIGLARLHGRDSQVGARRA
jgi:hypothetical protein